MTTKQLDANFILQELSSLDQNPTIASTSVLYGFVVRTVSFDIDSLDQAAHRVAEKWRLIAARLGRQNNQWHLRIPLGPLDQIQTHGLTTTHVVHSLGPASLVAPHPDVASIIPRPDRKYFRHPNTPSSYNEIYARQTPLVNIHVTTFTDCTCIGITLPHGIFDATGAGLVVHALDAELNGKPWTPPLPSPENPMCSALSALPSKGDYIENECVTHTRDNFVGYHPWNLFKFLWTTLVEVFWFKAEVKGLFLGEHVVQKIVQRAREQAPTNSSLKPTTGDILVSWFLKAIHHSNTKYLDEIGISSVISMRSIFAQDGALGFNHFPHNCVVPFGIPSRSVRSVRGSSVFEIAADHRDCVEKARTMDFVRSYFRWYHSPRTASTLIPMIRRSFQSWEFTNHAAGRVDAIDFGAPVSHFWFWNVPFYPVHCVVINKFNGGYVLEPFIRRKEWKAIELEVKKLNLGQSIVF